VLITIREQCVDNRSSYKLDFNPTMKVLFSTLTLIILGIAAFGQSGQSPLAPPKSAPAGAPPGTSVKLKLGDKAPDFALANGDGKLVVLSEYTQRTPVVLVFYRGFW
jgi:hypothetical protein